MKDIYLLLGSEAALADRALGKLLAELKQERAEITTLFAGEVSVGEISDALSPSLFSERRALILRDLQDLAEEAKNEITRYLDATDETDTSDESEVTDEQESEVTETKDDTSEVTDEQESVVVLAYEDIGLHPYVILSDYKLKVTAAAAKAITDKKITEQLTPKDIECIAAFKYWTRNGNNFSLDVKE